MIGIIHHWGQCRENDLIKVVGYPFLFLFMQLIKPEDVKIVLFKLAGAFSLPKKLYIFLDL